MFYQVLKSKLDFLISISSLFCLCLLATVAYSIRNIVRGISKNKSTLRKSIKYTFMNLLRITDGTPVFIFLFMFIELIIVILYNIIMEKAGLVIILVFIIFSIIFFSLFFLLLSAIYSVLSKYLQSSSSRLIKKISFIVTNTLLIWIFSLSVGYKLNRLENILLLIIMCIIYITNLSILFRIVSISRQKQLTKSDIVISSLVVAIILVFVISTMNYQCVLLCNDYFGQSYPPSYFDIVYFTIITFATIGYGDFHPTTILGKCISILTAITSVIFLVIFINSIINAKSKKDGDEQKIRKNRINNDVMLAFSVIKIIREAIQLETNMKTKNKVIRIIHGLVNSPRKKLRSISELNLSDFNNFEVLVNIQILLWDYFDQETPSITKITRDSM